MEPAVKHERTGYGGFGKARPVSPVDWRVDDGLIDYQTALTAMEETARAIRDAAVPEKVWLLQHPSLYTAGTSAKPGDILEPDRFPVHHTGRGGQYTYHGPGQRVAYVMLDLQQRGADIRGYIYALEQWLIDTLWLFNLRGERRRDRVGVWVKTGGGTEAKIAAIGVRIRKWVSYHGVALNVDPQLSHFEGIVPCGIDGFGVTSLAALGYPISMAEADSALQVAFERLFGPVSIIAGKDVAAQ